MSVDAFRNQCIKKTISQVCKPSSPHTEMLKHFITVLRAPLSSVPTEELKVALEQCSNLHKNPFKTALSLPIFQRLMSMASQVLNVKSQDGLNEKAFGRIHDAIEILDEKHLIDNIRKATSKPAIKVSLAGVADHIRNYQRLTCKTSQQFMAENPKAASVQAKLNSICSAVCEYRNEQVTSSAVLFLSAISEALTYVPLGQDVDEEAAARMKVSIDDATNAVIDKSDQFLDHGVFMNKDQFESTKKQHEGLKKDLENLIEFVIHYSTVIKPHVARPTDDESFLNTRDAWVTSPIFMWLVCTLTSEAVPGTLSSMLVGKFRDDMSEIITGCLLSLVARVLEPLTSFATTIDVCLTRRQDSPDAPVVVNLSIFGEGLHLFSGQNHKKFFDAVRSSYVITLLRQVKKERITITCPNKLERVELSIDRALCMLSVHGAILHLSEWSSMVESIDTIESPDQKLLELSKANNYLEAIAIAKLEVAKAASPFPELVGKPSHLVDALKEDYLDKTCNLLRTICTSVTTRLVAACGKMPDVEKICQGDTASEAFKTEATKLIKTPTSKAVVPLFAAFRNAQKRVKEIKGGVLKKEAKFMKVLEEIEASFNAPDMKVSTQRYANAQALNGCFRALKEGETRAGLTSLALENAKKWDTNLHAKIIDYIKKGAPTDNDAQSQHPPKRRKTAKSQS